MRVSELGVADVGEAVPLRVVPAVTQLRQPQERLGAVHLLCDHLGHHVTGVHVDGADRHDLLTVSRRQVSQQHGDQIVQLGDLQQECNN